MQTSFINRLFGGGSTPRWVIFAFDSVIVLCSLMLAYMLRFNFRIPEVEVKSWQVVVPMVTHT